MFTLNIQHIHLREGRKQIKCFLFYVQYTQSMRPCSLGFFFLGQKIRVSKGKSPMQDYKISVTCLVICAIYWVHFPFFCTLLSKKVDTRTDVTSKYLSQLTVVAVHHNQIAGGHLDLHPAFASSAEQALERPIKKPTAAAAHKNAAQQRYVREKRYDHHVLFFYWKKKILTAFLAAILES